MLGVVDYVGMIEDYTKGLESGDLSGFSERHGEFLGDVDVNDRKAVLDHIRERMNGDLDSTQIGVVRSSLRFGRERYGEGMDPEDGYDLRGPHF